MFRNFVLFAFVLKIVATLVPTGFAIAQDPSRLELPTIEECRIQFDSLQPSLVQFSYDGLHFGCGVIVSSEGHIVVSGPVAAVLDNKLMELRLTDGRLVRGEALGWSSEFGFGVLKITEPGEWTVAKFSDTIKTGEVCMALGYHRDHDGPRNRPQAKLSLVTRISPDGWFTTSHQSDFNGHPVFNMHGELLGLGTSSPANDDAIHCHGKLIRENWRELTANQNFDRTRLCQEVSSENSVDSLPDKMSEETLAKIKAATVQLGDVGKNPEFSGVIVPDGYIISCAHHGRITGHKLAAVLSDGRTVSAIVTGTDWIADVCVLKIEDEVELPSANLGFSTQFTSGIPVVAIGYPIKNKQSPMILTTQVSLPKNSLKRRDELHRELSTDLAEDNSGGASGGGVFDTAGNVVGIILGDGATRHARVELFRRNWDDLTNGNAVDVVAPELRSMHRSELARISDSINKR